jgi:hypothetical protein
VSQEEEHAHHFGVVLKTNLNPALGVLQEEERDHHFGDGSRETICCQSYFRWRHDDDEDGYETNAMKGDEGLGSIQCLVVGGCWMVVSEVLVKIFAVDVVDVVGRSRRREWVEERSLYIRTESLATKLSRIQLQNLL